MSDINDDELTEEQLEAAIAADETAAAASADVSVLSDQRTPLDLGDPGDVWDDVVGQKQAIGHLRAAVARGPVHAYLFVGPSGSTKL